MGNGLENYCYSLKGSISSDEVKDKIPADDKKSLEDKIDETFSWLDGNQSGEKQKELEGVALPILQKMGGGGGMGGRPDVGGMPDMSGAGAAGAPPADEPAGGPTIEEID